VGVWGGEEEEERRGGGEKIRCKTRKAWSVRRRGEIGGEGGGEGNKMRWGEKGNRMGRGGEETVGWGKQKGRAGRRKEAEGGEGGKDIADEGCKGGVGSRKGAKKGYGQGGRGRGGRVEEDWGKSRVLGEGRSKERLGMRAGREREGKQIGGEGWEERRRQSERVC